jgi:nicotinic acid mononucleotide adenylyltransferase
MSTSIVVFPNRKISSNNQAFVAWGMVNTVYTGGIEAHIDKKLLVWYATQNKGNAQAVSDSNEQQWDGFIRGSWYTGTSRQRIVIKSRDCALLIVTGALNPVHNGHMQMLKYAHMVLSGIYVCMRHILSPSHDEYVDTKPGALPFVVRAQLARTINDVTVNTWEGTQDHFVDYPDVITHFEEDITDADVYYIVGADHFHNHVKGDARMTGKRVIVVPRTDVSSTNIRQITDRTELRSLVPPGVADIIIHSGLYGFSRVVKDMNLIRQTIQSDKIQPNPIWDPGMVAREFGSFSNVIIQAMHFLSGLSTTCLSPCSRKPTSTTGTVPVGTNPTWP